MRHVLGIDPGFAALGYSVVAADRDTEQLVELGVIVTTPAKVKVLKSDDAFARLRTTSERLHQLALKYKIDAVAFESLSIPQQTSKQNAIKIGHPYGIVACLSVVHSMAAVQVTPQFVKKVICGASNASKEDVESAVRARFADNQEVVARFEKSFPASVRNHAWDALAAYVASRDTEVMRALLRA